MNRLENIIKQRKLQGKTWNELAEKLPIQGNSLRVAFERGSVDDAYLLHVENILNIQEDTIKENKNIVQEPSGEVYKKELNKQLDDFSYAFFRKMEGIEGLIKYLALDMAHIKTRVDDFNSDDLKKALEDIAEMKEKL